MENRYEYRKAAEAPEGVRLGVALTLIMLVAYFAFICAGAFSPALLAAKIASDSPISWAFVLGMAIIILGVVLTSIFVWSENKK